MDIRATDTLCDFCCEPFHDMENFEERSAATRRPFHDRTRLYRSLRPGCPLRTALPSQNMDPRVDQHRDVSFPHQKTGYSQIEFAWSDSDDHAAGAFAFIDLEDFLPTFRYAITVSRRLDTRYLWADCYYIIHSASERNDYQQHDIKRMIY